MAYSAAMASPRTPTSVPTALVGVDFSSAPSARKPVALAWGQRQGSRVSLQRLQACAQHRELLQTLQSEPAWVGGFDLPFGLPRALVEHLGWPTQWAACMDHYCGLSRAEIRDTFAAYTAARPAGREKTLGSVDLSPIAAMRQSGPAPKGCAWICGHAALLTPHLE